MVLKKLSKEGFDGFADDVKGIKQELQHMYVCVPHVRKSRLEMRNPATPHRLYFLGALQLNGCA